MKTLTQQMLDEWFAVGANDPTHTRESLPIGQVRHYLNHCVLVTDGPHAGKRVSIISLVDIAPETMYLAELPDGKDIVVGQSSLIADEETWKATE